MSTIDKDKTSKVCTVHISGSSLTHSSNGIFNISFTLYLFLHIIRSLYDTHLSYIQRKKCLLYAITFGSIAEQALLFLNQVRTHPIFVFCSFSLSLSKLTTIYTFYYCIGNGIKDPLLLFLIYSLIHTHTHNIIYII